MWSLPRAISGPVLRDFSSVQIRPWCRAAWFAVYLNLLAFQVLL